MCLHIEEFFKDYPQQLVLDQSVNFDLEKGFCGQPIELCADQVHFCWKCAFLKDSTSIS